MEENTVKTTVFDTKTLLSETAEQPIDVDFTLPEYYPDIDRILKCQCTPYVTSKGMNGSTATAEGTAAINVIYVDTDNMLNSYEYQYPFSKTFDAVSYQSTACLCVGARTEYINCRAVTQRKIDIHGAVAIDFSLREKEMKEIVTDITDKDTEQRKEKINLTVPLGCSEKYVNIEEDIEIGAGAEDINCVIRYSGASCVTDSKIMANKAVIKGELSINLLYCNEAGEICPLKEKIPYSTLIEADGLSESCSTETSSAMAFLEIKPKSDSEGKVRSFSVNAKILLTVNTFCSEEVDAVLDAYSRKYETEISYVDMGISNITEKGSDSFAVRGNIRFSDTKIGNVTDMWCGVRLESASVNGSSLDIQGVLSVFVILNDKDASPVYFEREIPFEQSREITAAESLMPSAELCVLDCGYSITSEDSLEIRAEIGMNYTVFCCKKIKLLGGISVNTEKPINRKWEYAMIIYFGNKGENVWDIAARYLSDTEEIKKINELESDILTKDVMLLVPIM